MSEFLADDALYTKGLAVLEDYLGPVETLRFLALVSRHPSTGAAGRSAVG
jgi:hypothetical protein